MSWLGYKATNSKSESETREEKRRKLEQERLFRSKQETPTENNFKLRLIQDEKLKKLYKVC